MMDILDRPKLVLEQKLLDQDASVDNIVTKNVANALTLYLSINNNMRFDIIPLSWWKNGIEIALHHKYEIVYYLGVLLVL